MKTSELKVWIIPIILTISLFSGLIKSISGIRYFPLIIDLVIFIYFTFWLVPQLIRHHLRFGLLDLLVFIFITIAFIGIFNKNMPSIATGLEGFRKFAFMLFGFYVGRYFLDVRTLKRIVIILIVTSFFISIYGIKQFLLPSALDYRLIELSTASPVTYMMGGHIRAFSTLSGPFHLGLFLTCIILLLTVLLQHKPENKIIYLFLLIPLLVALIMTVTKSNWLGLAIGIIFSIFLKSVKILRFTFRILLLLLLLLGIVILLMNITTSIPVFQTINTGIQALINPLEAPTMLFRLNLWKDTILPLISLSPWLGYGTGSAGEGLSNYFIDTRSIFVVAHNIFLKVQFELGLAGLIFFLLILATTFFQILKIRKKLNDRFLLIICDWTLSFFVAIMVAGMVGSILDAYPINLMFWILVGVSTVLKKLDNIDNSNISSKSTQNYALQEEGK